MFNAVSGRRAQKACPVLYFVKGTAFEFFVDSFNSNFVTYNSLT